jgi:hypothetical protein
MDVMRNPPKHLESFRFDEKAEIENLNANNGLDFYSDIMRTTFKMQDCHHSFIPPFLLNFVYLLPFLIDSEISNSGLNRKFKFISDNSLSNVAFSFNCLLPFVLLKFFI